MYAVMCVWLYNVITYKFLVPTQLHDISKGSQFCTKKSNMVICKEFCVHKINIWREHYGLNALWLGLMVKCKLCCCRCQKVSHVLHLQLSLPSQYCRICWTGKGCHMSQLYQWIFANCKNKRKQNQKSIGEVAYISLYTTLNVSIFNIF